MNSCANPAWLHIGRKWRQHPQQRRRQERFKGHIRQRQRIVVHLGGHDSLKAAPNPPISPGLTRPYQVLPGLTICSFCSFCSSVTHEGIGESLASCRWYWRASFGSKARCNKQQQASKNVTMRPFNCGGLVLSQLLVSPRFYTGLKIWHIVTWMTQAQKTTLSNSTLRRYCTLL